MATYSSLDEALEGLDGEFPGRYHFRVEEGKGIKVHFTDIHNHALTRQIPCPVKATAAGLGGYIDVRTQNGCDRSGYEPADAEGAEDENMLILLNSLLAAKF